MTLAMPLPTFNVRQTHPTPRKYLELIQDVIVFCLCVMLLVTMGIKLSHLARLLIEGTDFSLVVGDILFVLVLVELFRLLLIYLEEHRVSVATMVEVGIVANTLAALKAFASAAPKATRPAYLSSLRDAENKKAKAIEEWIRSDAVPITAPCAQRPFRRSVSKASSSAWAIA